MKKRLLAGLLSVVMLFGAVDISALATESSGIVLPEGLETEVEPDADGEFFDSEETQTLEWPEEIELPEGVELAEPAAVGEVEVTQEEMSEGTLGMEDVSVTATNSFGELLMQAYDAKAEVQEENGGYNVFSADVSGKQVTVSYEALENSTLVVGVYEETGSRLLASGSVEVTAGYENAVVNIETDSMPAYFYLRVFLVESESMRPLCTVFESSLYTQEMQEFLSKTTDDFDADRVLNLDEDKTTNFAVYEESTKIIEQGSGVNVAASVDEVNRVYVIENADASVTSLKTGDIFSYEYEDGEVLIVKVASVSVSGTTVTIHGAETSMEEVFEYVKVEAESNMQEAEVDASKLGDGITYNGIVDSSEQTAWNAGVENDRWGGEYSSTFSSSFSLDTELENESDMEVTIEGGIELSLTPGLKFYVTESEKYFELKIDYGLKLYTEISGKMRETIPLAEYKFPLASGVFLEVTPSFVMEVGGAFEVDGALTGTVGFRKDGNGELENLTSLPALELGYSGEMVVFVGMSLEPEITIIDDCIAEAGLTVELGAEEVISSNIGYMSNERHECVDCYAAEINGRASLGVSLSFFDLEDWTFSRGWEVKEKVADAYYSLTYNEAGFGECPHRKYAIDLTVLGGNKLPIRGASITAVTPNDDTIKAESVTSNKGKARIFLPGGTNEVKVSASGFDTVSKKVEVDGTKTVLLKCSEVSVLESAGMIGLDITTAYAVTENGNMYTWGANNCGQLGDGTTSISNKPIKIMNNVAYAEINDSVGLVIKKDGSLWTWGDNGTGQLGDGTDKTRYIPKKIMDDIVSARVEHGMGYAIKEDGSLWTWGDNRGGQLGDGTNKTRYIPQKIMDDVLCAEIGTSFAAAIKKDGSLWTWGWNSCGELGDGTIKTRYTPEEIMSSVVSIEIENTSVIVIKKDGSLYAWGNNVSGQLGDGTRSSRSTPVFIMDHVADVMMNVISTVAIKEDGSMWTWGDNYYGQLGDRTKKDRYVPVKIMDDVSRVDMSDRNAVAIKKDGSLWTWGDNYYGQLGNGTWGAHSTSTIPIKIMNHVSNVCVGPVSAMAVKEDGSLYTWGYDYYGTLGNGTLGYTHKPAKITLDPNISALYQDTTATYLETETMETFVEADLLPDGASIDIPEDSTQLTGLLPNEQYNYYILKNRYAETPLSADNLLYIRQLLSDANGTLQLEGEPREVYEGADAFVVGMTRQDISSAEVIAKDMYYNGEEQYADVAVYVNNKKLEEGTDYELYGSYRGTEIGKYAVTVKGIGTYTGSCVATYQIMEPYVAVYTVSFDSQEGSAVPSQQVTENTCAIEPSIPARSGYSFLGWYLDDVLYDFSTPVTDNITLEAKWTKLSVYTVYFQSNGGSSVSSQKVTENSCAIEPTAPIRNGYTFLGWYLNGQLYDFSTPVTGNITLRAKWQQQTTPAGPKDWVFTDVAQIEGNWKYESVKYVYENNIMNGIAGTTLFDPDGQLNRAMFATVLYRMAGSPSVTYANKFTDVAPGKYYSNAIIWANQKGIVNGFSDGSYGVTTNITREQIAKMLCEYASKQGYDVSGKASLNNFTDAAQVSGWATGYMQWAVNAGMISGKPNGDGSFRLDPKGQATRAECAKMLMMFLKKYN